MKFIRFLFLFSFVFCTTDHLTFFIGNIQVLFAHCECENAAWTRGQGQQDDVIYYLRRESHLENIIDWH